MIKTDEQIFIDECFSAPKPQVVPANVVNLPIRAYMDMSITRGLDVHFDNLLNYYTEEEVRAYIAKRWENI